jgi:transaldolase
MKFFADTANYDEITYSFSRHVNDGITTNPKIMENYGVSNFKDACESLLIKYPNVPLSLETDLRGLKVEEIESKAEEVKSVLLKQAHELARLGNNIVVKIPICTGGLEAVKKLTSEGVATNVTACMTPFQAIEAAKAGATYVSLFANRMLDSHVLELSGHNKEEIVTDTNWKVTVKENKDKYFDKAWENTIIQIAYVAKKLEDEFPDSQLIVGSIRSPDDILKIANAQPQIITIPTKIVEGLQNIPEIKQTKRTLLVAIPEKLIGESTLYHPMTQYSLDEFEKAADSYRKL